MVLMLFANDIRSWRSVGYHGMRCARMSVSTSTSRCSVLCALRILHTLFTLSLSLSLSLSDSSFSHFIIHSTVVYTSMCKWHNNVCVCARTFHIWSHFTSLQLISWWSPRTHSCTSSVESCHCIFFLNPMEFLSSFFMFETSKKKMQNALIYVLLMFYTFYRLYAFPNWIFS